MIRISHRNSKNRVLDIYSFYRIQR